MLAQGQCLLHNPYSLSRRPPPECWEICSGSLLVGRGHYFLLWSGAVEWVASLCLCNQGSMCVRPELHTHAFKCLNPNHISFSNPIIDLSHTDVISLTLACVNQYINLEKCASSVPSSVIRTELTLNFHVN